MNRVHKTMLPFIEAIAPRQWSVDVEFFENVEHAVYFVMDGNTTVAVCRRREDAEQIVKDHNK